MENECYLFVGEGAGVPGLPHQITITQAIELGVIEILQAAIANGNYVKCIDDPGTGAEPDPAEEKKGKRRQ